MTDVSAALYALSEWIDDGNACRDPEAVTWGRLAKIDRRREHPPLHPRPRLSPRGSPTEDQRIAQRG